MTAVRAWLCMLWICACAGSLARAGDVVLSPHAASERSCVLPGGEATLRLPTGTGPVGERILAPTWPESRLVR